MDLAVDDLPRRRSVKPKRLFLCHVMTRLLPQDLTALLVKLHPDKCSEYSSIVQGSRGDSIELQGRLQMKKPGRAHHDAPQWLRLGGAADASVNLLTGR